MSAHQDKPVLVARGLTTIDQGWAFLALADECIGERTCETCGAVPGQPCSPEPHRALTAAQKAA